MSEKNLTFTSQGLTNIQLYKFGAPYEITLYYKKGNTTATKYTFGADGKGPAISLSDGQSVEFYGTNNKFSKDKFNYYSFNTIGTGTISLDGNIMSLIGINKLNIINNYEFYNLFGNCDNIVTAERLQLPAKKLAPYCYAQLFQNCDNLVTAPQKLPATSLAQKCYLSMFRGCSSLDTPPVLKATTLVPYCYEQMFYECISLVNAPKLKAHELREGCYKEMFKGCTGLHTLSVKFTQWKDGYGATSFWLGETFKTGVFSMPKALVDRRGDSFIPDTWTTKYNDNDSEEEGEVPSHDDDSPSVVALEYFAGNGLALDNYTFSLTGTVLSAGTGISVANNIISLTASIPSAVSELVNDRGYITAADVPEGAVYVGGNGISVANNTITLTATIPTRVSDLTDAANYVLVSQLPSVPTKTSQLTNDSGFITAADVPEGAVYVGGTGISVANNTISLTATIPTKTSQLTNDSGYLTAHQDLSNYVTVNSLTAYALKSDILTKTSQLTNDVGFITISNVPTKTSDLVNDSGFITAADVPEGAVYVGGPGISVANNTISLTATIPPDYGNSITNLSTKVTTNTTNISSLSTKVTTNTTNITAISSNYAKKTEILTKTSQLTNDAGFITSAQLPSDSGEPIIYTAGNGLTLNGTEFSLTAQIPDDLSDEVAELSTKVTTNTTNISSLSTGLGTATSNISTISSNYAKNATVTTINNNVTTLSTGLTSVSSQVGTNKSNISTISTNYAKKTEVPTKVSQLTNDAGYITSAQLPSDSGEPIIYTAGNGLTLNGTEFSLTANIPDDLSDEVAELSTKVTTNTTNISSLSTQVGTNKSSITTISTNFAKNATVTTISNNVTTLSTGLTSVSSQVGTNKSNIATISSNYAKKTDIKTYTAGTGLDLNGTEFSLTASIPTKVSQLLNDSAYITYSQCPQPIEYTAGYGLTLNGTEFSLTATIPTYSATESIGIDTDNENALSVNATWLNTKGQGGYSAIYEALKGILTGGTNVTVSSSDNNETFAINCTAQGGKTYSQGTGISLTNDTITLTGTVLSGGTGIEIVNKRINLTYTDLGDFTNDAGYIKGSDLLSSESIDITTITNDNIDSYQFSVNPAWISGSANDGFEAVYKAIKNILSSGNGVECEADDDEKTITLNGGDFSISENFIANWRNAWEVDEVKNMYYHDNNEETGACKNGNSFTTPSAGWIYAFAELNSNGSKREVRVRVNGGAFKVASIEAGSGTKVGAGFTIPVRKGAVISMDLPNTFITGDIIGCVFYATGAAVVIGEGGSSGGEIEFGDTDSIEYNSSWHEFSVKTDWLSTWLSDNGYNSSDDVNTLSSNVDTLSSDVGTISSDIGTLSNDLDGAIENIAEISANLPSGGAAWIPEYITANTNIQNHHRYLCTVANDNSFLRLSCTSNTQLVDGFTFSIFVEQLGFGSNVKFRDKNHPIVLGNQVVEWVSQDDGGDEDEFEIPQALTYIEFIYNESQGAWHCTNLSLPAGQAVDVVGLLVNAMEENPAYRQLLRQKLGIS